MPVPRYTKKDRKQGVQIYRPFGKFDHIPSTISSLIYNTVYGSIAKPIDPAHRKDGTHQDHTHEWTVYVKGVDDEDISYWLKKVQFKLHETYPNSSRMVEAPPFSVTETGWGEFELQMKLYFVPEANEKAQTLWHHLKLHPYGPDAEGQRERKDAVVSQCYEEVLFNEPVEPFYDILTSGPPPQVSGRGKASKGSKQASLKGKGERSAEIPYADSGDNPYSQKAEAVELDRLREAMKTVDAMVKGERERLKEKEREMEGLRKEAGEEE